MTREYDIVHKFGLHYYYSVVLHHNAANTLPYHNLYHTMTVFRWCHELALSEGLERKRIRLLLIAALFHDFNHCGMRKPDEVNIGAALEAFFLHSRETAEDSKTVSDLIRATQYPHLPVDMGRLENRIIRDADLLQTLEPNFFQQVVLGYGVQEQCRDLAEYLEGEITFLQNLSFHTEYARQQWTEMTRTDLIDTCRYHLSLLKNVGICETFD